MVRVILTSFLLCVSFSAHALIVEWELVDFQFDDGGTANGTFTFDTSSNQFVDIDIYTTAGADLGSRHFINTAGSWGSFPENGTLAFSDYPGGPVGFTGAGYLRIDADIDYEAEVGDIVNQRIVVGKESFCINTGCSSAANDITNPDMSRDTVSGYLTAKSVVPLPAAAWLFISALAGLGWLRRTSVT